MRTLICTCESVLIVFIVIVYSLNYSLYHDKCWGYVASNEDVINNWFIPGLGYSSKQNLYYPSRLSIFDVFHTIGYNFLILPVPEEGLRKPMYLNPPKLLNVLKNSRGLQRNAKVWMEGIFGSIPWVKDNITYKASLVSCGGKYIPKAFHLPRQAQEFKSYVANLEITGNKNTHWLQKNTITRGHAVKKLIEIDLSAESIVQQFVTDPLLMEERKFSIAFYVMFTSANPLRAYIVKSDVIIRASGKAYYPVDLLDPATYVSENPEIYDIKFAKDFIYLDDCMTRTGYGVKSSLDAYLMSKGYNASDMYSQMYDAIDDVITSRIHLSRDADHSKAKYFHITRWDFLLDENCNLYLMEVEGIPTIPSFMGKFGRLGIHIVYNIARLSGLSDINSFQDQPATYVVRESDLNIYLDICYTSSCKSCTLKECQLCTQCLSRSDINVLSTVYSEHLNMLGNMKLVYPVVDMNDNGGHVEHLTKDDNNTLTIAWLQAKCNSDTYWCKNNIK